jgi:hypothetical protein
VDLQNKTFERRPFLPNPPIEDAVGGEAGKFLGLPCGMFILLNACPMKPLICFIGAQPIQLGRSLFLWGQTQILIRHLSLAD